MKIAIIGATGFVGSALVNEGLFRGHFVTAIARHTDKITKKDHLIAKDASVSDKEQLVAALKGNDVVISAFNAGWTNPNLYRDFINGSKAIQEAVMDSGIQRYIVVGGAGSLFIAPGQQLVDSPGFPESYKPGALAARDYLNALKEEQSLDWTYVSPAIEMGPGVVAGRTAKYRTGLDNPVFDENNKSVLSVEDLAVVILDEAEQGNHIRKRFTAAY